MLDVTTSGRSVNNEQIYREMKDSLLKIHFNALTKRGIHKFSYPS